MRAKNEILLLVCVLLTIIYVSRKTHMNTHTHTHMILDNGSVLATDDDDDDEMW